METDVFISGGGLAGLTLAAALADAGLAVVLADPAPPVADPEAEGSDLRSTAYLQPARDLFERVGVWPALAPHATPLSALRIVETEGHPPHIRADRTFRADDVSDRPFGWNVPNWRARAALAEAVAERVDLRLGTGFASMLARDAHVLLTLSDGSRLRARLAIGADGRGSPLRAAAGIEVRTTRYGQKALAFAVSHDVPHATVSIEIYRRGGAFTLVPLPDHEGRPASAVVWMHDGPATAALARMTPEALGLAATERSAAVLGQLRPITPVGVFPIVTQEATRLTARRTALVAEAAHVLPPIGAQGLNTSLADVAALARLAGEDPEGVGTPDWLARFEADRARDIRVRALAIDLFNRLCRSDDPAAHALRATGLRAVHDSAPVRRRIMQAGLGV